MIELTHPWVLALLPLPILAYWLLPAARRQSGAALRVPFHSRFGELSAGASAAAGRAGLIVGLKAMAWSLLVLAAARPVWLGESQPISSRGRDLMLALDLSGSMEIPDFEVQGQALDRLTVVREVAKGFVDQREGDRLGLVLFGSRAYLQAPITRDRATLTKMLDEAELGLAGEETAIGDAIGLAVKHLRERPNEERVLVLLSDGENNAGVLEPGEAADIAAAAGVKIYTIGIGSGMQMVRTPFGTRMVPGDNSLDERALAEIAEKTGGLYFRARDTAGLIAAHQQIDQLEKTEGEVVTVRPTRELFFWPLAGAMGLVGALVGFAAWRELLRPKRGPRGGAMGDPPTEDLFADASSPAAPGTAPFAPASDAPIERSAA